MVAVVTLTRVLARMSKWENKLSNVRSFIILQSGEGLPSFNKVNSANVSGESKVQWSFPGCPFVLVLELKSLYSVSLHIMLSHDKFGRKHPCKE